MKYLKLYEDFSDWDDEDEEEDEDVQKIDKFVEILETYPIFIKDYVFYSIIKSNDDTYLISAYNLKSAQSAQDKYTNFLEFLDNVDGIKIPVYITNVNNLKIINYRIAESNKNLSLYLDTPNATKTIVDNIEKDDSMVYAVYTQGYAKSPDNMCFYDSQFNVIINDINYLLDVYGKYLIYYKIVDQEMLYIVIDSLSGEVLATKKLKFYAEINDELLNELGIEKIEE